MGVSTEVLWVGVMENLKFFLFLCHVNSLLRGPITVSVKDSLLITVCAVSPWDFLFVCFKIEPKY